MKTNAHFLTVFALVVFSIKTTAQTQNYQELVVLKNDSISSQQTPKRLALASNRDLLLAGQHNDQGFISRVSACGTLLWTRNYLLGDQTDLVSIAELPSGDIVAVGSCRNCAPGDSTGKALIIKTDAQGFLLADTTLGNFNFEAAATSVVLTADGSLAIAGQAVWFGFLFPNDAFLARLTPGLHLLSFNTYHLFYYDYINEVIQLSDGGFALAGESSPALFSPGQATVYRTDATGSLIWKTALPHLNSSFNSICQNEEGHLVSLGDRLMDTTVNKEVFLAVLGIAGGGVLQEQYYGSPANDIGYSITKTNEGYLVGATYGQPSQLGWSQRDWVFHLDENYQAGTSYYKDSYLYGHFMTNTIALTDDGQDFAFCSKLIFFDSRQYMLIKRTRQGHLIALSQTPKHNQLYPRNISSNTAIVNITGTLANPAAYDALTLEVYREHALVQTISANSAQQILMAVEIPAELANYNFRLSGQKNGNYYTEAEACGVVAGDAYIIQGQSNAEAAAPYDPLDTIPHAYRYHKNEFVRNFGLAHTTDSVYVWHKEKNDYGAFGDNRSGQWGLVMGNLVCNTTGIPVAILNGGVSGISIDNMMPDPADHHNQQTTYGRFLRSVEQSGLLGHFRAILMFQGETNAAGGIWDSADNYLQKFSDLDQYWEQDFQHIPNRYLFQIRPGAYWAGATLLTCLQIEEAQRRIALELTPWTIMSSTGLNHDGTHYYYTNGYEKAGTDMFRLIAHELYGIGNGQNTYPPVIDSIWFSRADRQELTLRLANTGDEYAWYPGWESDFRLEGASNVSVLSGEVSGHLLRLELSEAPGSGFTGLSYTSHPVGPEAPVKNLNDIGLLTFYNMPVSSFVTDVETITPGETTIALWPNPCANKVEISARGAVDYECVVTDTQGHIFLTQTAIPRDGLILNIQHWPTGVYCVYFYEKHAFRGSKILIKK